MDGRRKMVREPFCMVVFWCKGEKVRVGSAWTDSDRRVADCGCHLEELKQMDADTGDFGKGFCNV